MIGAGGTAAVLYEFFHDGLHVGDAFGVLVGYVLSFADVLLQIVELDGFVFAAFGPAARTGAEDELPVVRSNTGKSFGRTADGKRR